MYQNRVIRRVGCRYSSIPSIVEGKFSSSLRPWTTFLLFPHPCNSCFHREPYTNSLISIVNTLSLLISTYHFDQSPVFSDSTWHRSFVMVHRNPHPYGVQCDHVRRTDSECHLRGFSPGQHGVCNCRSGVIAWFLVTTITSTISIASTRYLYHIVPIINNPRQDRNPL